jgi:hypothetical protein
VGRGLLVVPPSPLSLLPFPEISQARADLGVVVWMLGPNWPHGGEIDIIEGKQNPERKKENSN